jgi:phosphotransferase system  glucose/maltose/N-acetylglucosamine-specific IIC component
MLGSAHVNTVAGLALMLTVGVGLTVMVKEDGTPGQPVDVGVTVIVPLIGAVVELVAVNEAILLPLPLAANPIAGLLFVQL